MSVSEAIAWLGRHRGVAVAFAASLVLLLVHAWFYRFLTDDAFISFRYARNLAHGHGLVFNPGLERVEGYSNFLWVLALAGLARAGASIEKASWVLSLLASVALWAVVARETLRRPPQRAWLAAIPVVGLALVRSVAVWSTSGLETRVFELLVVAGALRLAREVESLAAGESLRPWAAVLLGLACWTRPDGLVAVAGAFAAAAVFLIRRRSFAFGRVARQIAPFAVMVAAHFAFRFAYYHAWLPNTYDAKVGGRLWWDSGLRYLGAFALEYGLYLWPPLLIAGAVLRAREGRVAGPLVAAGLLLAQLLYLAAIGGDHFEYRPLDVMFPLLLLGLYDGARALARTPLGARALPVALGVIAIGLWEIPYQSHRQFPAQYLAGFPGGALDTREGRDFLAPDRDPVFRWPGLRAIAAAHRALIGENTLHFVAVRQEEHRLFLESVRPVGRALRRLVDEGRLPRDFYLALPSVGVIPYDADLPTLDRIGLTDRHVARSGFVRQQLIAHDKSATEDYARARGVDLWAEVRAVCDVGSADFLAPLSQSLGGEESYVAAEIEPGRYLVGRVPLGIARLRRRVPRLRFESMDDPRFVDRCVAEAIAEYRRRLRTAPDDDTRIQLGLLLGSRGEFTEALDLFETAAASHADDAALWLRIAWCESNLGQPGYAAQAVQRGIATARVQGRMSIVAEGEEMLRTIAAAGTSDPGVASGR